MFSRFRPHFIDLASEHFLKGDVKIKKLIFVKTGAILNNGSEE